MEFEQILVQWPCSVGLCKLEAGWTIRKAGPRTVLSGPGPFLRQRAVCIRGPGLGSEKPSGLISILFL